MIRIRTKLFLFLLLLAALLNSVAYFLYQNGQRSIDEYNRVLQRFYLLNEVSQQTSAVFEQLNVYLAEQTPEAYGDYLRARTNLKRKQDQLSAIATQANGLTVDNYRNMITSFLEECAIVSGSFQSGSIDRYSAHLPKAERISLFIKETTLDLLNEELARYQNFYLQMNKKSAYFQSMGIFVFVSTFLLCALFALWFSRGITQPIGQLTAAAREISQGQLDGEPVQAYTKDELRFLTQTFNEMRADIRRLVGEIKEQSELDQLLKEMELKSLQSQIHPHFLFNILNTLSRTAYLEGAERASALIDSTAALMRHNLSRLDRPTTLGKEVEIIREYFFLQSARFGDRVSFRTEIDEGCLQRPVPNMTLQPIVENAFVHGIESYENGAEITIKIAPEGTDVLVEVSDNGVGMDEATRQRLLADAETEANGDERTFEDADRGEPDGAGRGEAAASRERERDGSEAAKPHGHSTGLGVHNVMKRLALFYRKEGLLDIQSAVGQGTTVRLRLPEITGGKDESL
ncbi:MAG TPA: sensor histidine kinase [Bacillales bacterium]|nr:sensor histidine kinase [Bacillales bacterium]